VLSQPTIEIRTKVFLELTPPVSPVAAVAVIAVDLLLSSHTYEGNDRTAW
jgi:hypothetical protein